MSEGILRSMSWIEASSLTFAQKIQVDSCSCTQLSPSQPNARLSCGDYLLGMTRYIEKARSKRDQSTVVTRFLATSNISYHTVLTTFTTQCWCIIQAKSENVEGNRDRCGPSFSSALSEPSKCEEYTANDMYKTTSVTPDARECMQ